MSTETKEVQFKSSITKQRYFEAIQLAHKASPAMVTANDVQDMFIAAGIDKVFADIEMLMLNYLENR